MVKDTCNLLGLSNTIVSQDNFQVVDATADQFNNFPSGNATLLDFYFRYDDLWYDADGLTGMLLCKMVAITDLSAAPAMVPQALMVALVSALITIISW